MAPQKPALATRDALKETPHGYEFGGPLGALAISSLLPIVTYLFAFLCNDVSGCPAPCLLSPKKLFSPPPYSTLTPWQYALETLAREVGWPGVMGLLSWQALAGTLGWYGVSLVLYRILPAQEVKGVELASGGRLAYRLNSFYSALAILAVCAAGTVAQGADFAVWAFINRHYVGLLTSNVLIAYALATYVYVASFGVERGNKQMRELAAGGHSGNVIYDWFIGRELNPRVSLPWVGEVDIKSFMELRPGMLGWTVLNCAFMAKQYKTYGYVTDSMLIVVLSQAAYTLDALYNEPAILTTLDITTDGFGFMLAFGDLVWVPFAYTTSAHYLSVHPVALGPLYTALNLALLATGFSIFRLSNSEKNRFRSNPSDPRVAHLSYIETASGSRLLTSGWWGTARHVNYLGDWVQGWAYCLPTLAAGYKITPSVLYPGTRLVSTEGMRGWAVPLTYWYLLYFAILLVHRERRDEEKCRRKYGRDWERYCGIVRWRIVPGVY